MYKTWGRIGSFGWGFVSFWYLQRGVGSVGCRRKNGGRQWWTWEAGEGCWWDGEAVEEHWKGWKEFWGRVGCGEMEMGGCISSMDLSATLVNEISCLLRLNMKETIGELIWELKSREDLHISFTQFSTWDGINWISGGFNINDYWRDREVREDKVSVMDRKIDMGVRTASLL